MPQTHPVAQVRVNVGEVREVMDRERHGSLGASVLTTPTPHLMTELLKELRILRERHIDT